MMTYQEAKDSTRRHEQDAKTLTRTRKSELQALWRDELRRHGVLEPDPAAAGGRSKDELVNDILRWRYPTPAVNEASHVLYHAPSARWPGCEHCQAKPETETVNTAELRVGDVVLDRGMRVRIDDIREYVPDGAGLGARAWTCPGTVLNLEQVLAEHVIPPQFLETYGYSDGWHVLRRDVWTVQGYERARWTVELPRPSDCRTLGYAADCETCQNGNSHV